MRNAIRSAIVTVAVLSLGGAAAALPVIAASASSAAVHVADGPPVYLHT